jgi:hypothetical protein
VIQWRSKNPLSRAFSAASGDVVKTSQIDFRRDMTHLATNALASGASKYKDRIDEFRLACLTLQLVRTILAGSPRHDSERVAAPCRAR